MKNDCSLNFNEIKQSCFENFKSNKKGNLNETLHLVLFLNTHTNQVMFLVKW